MEISITINEGCEHCKKALKYFKFLEKKHLNFYANMNLENYEFIDPMILSPDFNSCGHLTHFHIERTNEKSLSIMLKNMSTQREIAKKVMKLKRSKTWKTKDSQ